MTNPLHIPRPKENQRINTRQVQGIVAEDAERPTAGEYMAKALIQMQRHLGDLVKRQIDETKVFDEYQSAGLVPISTSSLIILPTYEYTERVESIIIVGPAGVVTLQLGDRLWSLTIPAAGFLVMAPVAIYLGRDDTRQLTAATPGAFSLELMGRADQRWST